MNKKLLIGVGVVVGVVVLGAVAMRGRNGTVQNLPGENVTAPSATPTAQAAVPLPQGEDIVRSFFALINEGKISDAVNMLSSNNQEWSAQLGAFKKVVVKSIEPAGENMYKVVLDVEMKPESENGPIPFYGYEKGENIRWVGVEKVDTLWKVTGIATGP